MADRCKFEVGDKVRRIAGTWASMNIGDVDEVIKVSEDSVRLKRYRTSTETVHSTNNLELVEVSHKSQKFNIGDIVVLITGKYGQSSLSDPQWGKEHGFVVGTVECFNKNLTYPYRVNWNNGRGNDYRANDLALLKNVKKVRTESDTKSISCVSVDVNNIEGQLRGE